MPINNTLAAASSRSLGLYNNLPSPALQLNFTKETLDSRVTFSRTSNATRINAQGLIEYAPHNLLTYSENFDNAVWVKSNATVTANAVVAPDGTTTADKLVENTAAGGPHGLAVDTNSLSSTTQYTLSVYAKAGERTWVRLGLVDNLGTDGGRAWFDLSTGVVGTVEINGAGSNINATITSIGAGWYRCRLTIQMNNGKTTLQSQVRLATANNVLTYTGDGTSGIYIWGAQLNIGSLQPYYTTSVKNLLGYSQNFENAAWSKSNSTIDATPVMGPLGFLGADKLVENTANSAHLISIAPTVVTNTPYVCSIYAKQGERRYFRFQSFNEIGDAENAIFDLQTGTIVSQSGTSASQIVSIGNGWYRCSITLINNTDTSSAISIQLYDNSITGSYTGDGSSGIYIFGAQLSDSASLDPYSYNTGAAPTSSAYYGPRFDYDPVTLAPKGLLIEEQRINSIRNNTMQGAVVGTPGTLPTNYTYTGGGLVANVVGIGYEGGINYVDIQFVGTATSGSSGLRFEGNAGVGASTGQTWNTSFYVRKISGTTSGISSIGTNLTYLIAGAGSDAITEVIPFDTLDLTSIAYNRQDVTLTAVTSGITTVRPQLIFGHTIGANIDITLRIGMPQLEQGAFPTSVIPTTSAQVTRTADNASMVGTNFSSWYNQSEGTVATEYDVILNTGNRIIFDIGANGAFGTTVYGLQTGSYIGILPGGAPVSVTSTVSTTTLVNKISVGLQTNNSTISANTVLGTTDTSCNMPASATTLTLGCSQFNGSFGNFLNGHIQSFKYFSKRLLNSYLQRLTR